MAKKLFSVVVSSLKKKPTKRINKRRKFKSALKMIFKYMKSDSYMFAPLNHPESSLLSPPASSGEVSFKPWEKKEKKLVEDVDDYLKCDTYMYAPLIRDSAYDCTTNPSSETARVFYDQMETAGDDEHRVASSRDTEHDDGRDPVTQRRIDVEHSLLQSERVKHILNQNCRSLSSTGEVLSQKKPRKVVVERAHTQLA